MMGKYLISCILAGGLMVSAIAPALTLQVIQELLIFLVK